MVEQTPDYCQTKHQTIGRTNTRLLAGQTPEYWQTKHNTGDLNQTSDGHGEFFLLLLLLRACIYDKTIITEENKF